MSILTPDTRIKPLTLTNDHGRHITVTPERALASVGECPLHAQPVDKHPRATCEHGNHVHVCVHSYSTVDEIKQRDVVNSGVRGTKDKNLRSRCVGELL